MKNPTSGVNIRVYWFVSIKLVYTTAVLCRAPLARYVILPHVAFIIVTKITVCKLLTTKVHNVSNECVNDSRFCAVIWNTMLTVIKCKWLILQNIIAVFVLYALYFPHITYAQYTCVITEGNVPCRAPSAIWFTPTNQFYDSIIMTQQFAKMDTCSDTLVVIFFTEGRKCGRRIDGRWFCCCGVEVRSWSDGDGFVVEHDRRRFGTCRRAAGHQGQFVHVTVTLVTCWWLKCNRTRRNAYVFMENYRKTVHRLNKNNLTILVNE